MILFPDNTKIATRKWCKENFGEASLVYYGNTSTLNECVHSSDLNQSSANIVKPTSDTNGAIPSSYLSNNNKCITETAMYDFYQHLQINTTCYIIKTNKTSTLSSYQLKCIATYNNYKTTASAYPAYGGLATNLTIIFGIDQFEKLSIRTRASTSITSTISKPINTSSNFIDSTIFTSASYSAATSGKTGILNYTDFLNAYIIDMYKYFNGESSNYSYAITCSLSPVAYISANTVLKPTYHIVENNVIATLATLTRATANISYTCTSKTSNRWNFTITITNKSNGTAQNLVLLSTDKGTIGTSSNTGTTTQTITGYVSYTPSDSSDVPYVTVTYNPGSAYILYKCTFSADLHL